jgi:magnesium transporter
MNYLYVVDERNRLIDDIALGSLLLAEEDTLVSEITDNHFVAITTTTSKEDAVHILKNMTELHFLLLQKLEFW